MISDSPEYLEKLGKEAQNELASITDEFAAESFRVKYLGKKGILREILKSVKDIPEEQRKQFGARANELRIIIEEKFNAAPWAKDKEVKAESTFDPGLPGFPFS